MNRVSIFENAFAGTARSVPCERVVEGIRSGHRADQIKNLRSMLSAGDRAGYDREKRNLPAFSLSAECLDRKTLSRHSGLIQADLDNLNGTLAGIRQKAKADPHVLAGFVSPSGNGLKLAIRVPADPERHRQSFESVERYIFATYGTEIDRACKDPLRLCFVSSDPDAWFNRDAIELNVETWRSPPASAVKIEATTEEADVYSENDAGRAKMFVDFYADSIRYVPAWKTWLVWENERWRIDKDGAVERFAIELSQQKLADAVRIPGTDKTSVSERDQAVRSALKLGDCATISNLLELARCDFRVILNEAEIDSDPLCIGARNGVVDLRDHCLRTYDRGQFITRSLGVDVDFGAKCPRWEQFIAEIFEDPDVARFVQKAAGYSLTGLSTEHIFLFLYGTGANGKSTFCEVLQAGFGDYGMRASDSLLRFSANGREPEGAIAEIFGKRLILGAETEEGARLNEKLIKDITGGDTLRGRRLYIRTPSHSNQAQRCGFTETTSPKFAATMMASGAEFV